MAPESLQASKAYLFLLSSKPSTSSSTRVNREKIVGCVIAQRISTAMAIASPGDVATASASRSTATPSSPKLSLHGTENRPPRSDDKEEPTALIPVDTSTNLFVHPKPLPTPMGIPRLFVSSSHRRLGIATKLLSAAAESFILGCPLNPAKGEVAFTQPTGAGKGVLEKWGKGGVRIYEE